MRRMGWVLVVVGLLPACSKSGGSTCDTRVDRMASELAALSQRQAGMAPRGITPIERPGGDELGPGTEVTIGPDGEVAAYGEPIHELTPGLREWFDTHDKVARETASQPIYLWPDKAVSAERVAEVAAAMPAGREVRLAFLNPAPPVSTAAAKLVQKPAVAAVRDRVMKLDPSQRAVAIAREMQKAVGTCAPLVKAFGKVATIAADGKAAFLARAVPAALKECHCGVGDLDMVEYLLLQTFGEWDRPMRWLPVAQAASVMAR